MSLSHAAAVAENDIERAVRRLLSLADGDLGLLDVVAIGPRAVPRLRALLFGREPSGLYQPRCRVVEALAALGAQDVLLEFLAAERHFPDPVEQAGEDAVLNAAARALHGVIDEAAIRRLLRLAETRQLSGPIEALGVLHRPEAVPALIAALGDDLARPAAEEALRRFDRDVVVGALATAAERPAGMESETSLRRRRAALALLLDLADPAAIAPARLAAWVADEDAAIGVLGCRIALAGDDPAARQAASARLLDLLVGVDWRIRREIEDTLVEHGAVVRAAVLARVAPTPPTEEDRSPPAEAQRSLARVLRRLGP
jgi:hypothetical protein